MGKMSNISDKKKFIIVAVLVFLLALAVFHMSTGKCLGKTGTSKDSCYYEGGFCSAIDESSSYYELCLVQKGIDKLDLDICSEINDEYRRENCISNVAEGLGDADICYDLETEYWADNCFFDVAYATNNTNLCITLGNDELRNTCYMDFAVITGNIKKCNGVDIELGDQCVLAVAKAHLDIEICEHMSNDFNHDVCVIKVVKLDTSLGPETCEEVVWSGLREECHSLFAEEAIEEMVSE